MLDITELRKRYVTIFNLMPLLSVLWFYESKINLSMILILSALVLSILVESFEHFMELVISKSPKRKRKLVKITKGLITLLPGKKRRRLSKRKELWKTLIKKFWKTLSLSKGTFALYVGANLLHYLIYFYLMYLSWTHEVLTLFLIQTATLLYFIVVSTLLIKQILIK